MSKSKKIKVKAGLKTRTIQVDYLARVEGEGALTIEYENNTVKTCHLKLFEPPRFFEAMLKSRHYSEAADITARICGICPVAYQMSAVSALEQALGLTVPNDINQLRRLMYCGEWIESHCLHIFMLHAPDLLGFDDAIAMSKRYPEIVKTGLMLKKLGNQIIKCLGGREIHPINVRVGGFYKIPTDSELSELKHEIEKGYHLALTGFDWVKDLTYPQFEQDYECVALCQQNKYPFMGTHVQSNKGLSFQSNDFENHIEEYQVPHSNALHAKVIARKHFLVGPMARYNLSSQYLPDAIKHTAKRWGFADYCINPFKSIMVRSLEVIYAFYEAYAILKQYRSIETPYVGSECGKSEGFGISEAPRGILYHHYKLDNEGNITFAKIIPPTSQNQATIEHDLIHFVKEYHQQPQDILQHQCEQAIRNYDPCISCATHFLKIHKIQ